MKIGSFQISAQRVLLFIGLALLLALIMDFNARLEELNSKQNHLATVSAQLTQAIATQQALQTAVGYAGSDAAAEEWARVQVGMAQPGDNPIVPLPGTGEAPDIPSAPTPVPTPFTRWDVWMALLFGP